MRRIDEFVHLFAFNRWATARLLDAVRELPPEQLTRDMGSSFPSIRETFTHVMGAEWIWLSRWNGSSPQRPPEKWAHLDFAGIEREWAQLDARLQAFVSRLDDADLDRSLPYRNTAGEPFVSELAQMLRHVINHSTYHRGQIVTMLRQLGAAAPATDLIVYYRAVSPMLDEPAAGA